tara:strand:- start:676 stop:903 length:228 start_codon:yes stop_codon:yes gene_type:complete
MKYFLVISFISMFSDMNQMFVTERSFDNFEECARHEVYVDHSDWSFALMCMDQNEIDYVTTGEMYLDMEWEKLPN